MGVTNARCRFAGLACPIALLLCGLYVGYPAAADAVVIHVVEAIGVTDTPSLQVVATIDVVEAISVADDVQATISGPDTDGDGVADTEEDAAPNGGDGNDDGTPDRLQASVASLPDPGGINYVTIEVAAGCAGLLDVATVAESWLPVEDLVYDYPFGLVSLRLPCTTATITAIFHGASSLVGPYRQYGPTLPGNPATAEWYTLSAATFGTKTVGGSTVATATFTLQDGMLGDDTAADGQIVSQGGPAVAAPPLIPSLPPVARLVLALLIPTGLWLGRRLGQRPVGNRRLAWARAEANRLPEGQGEWRS